MYAEEWEAHVSNKTIQQLHKHLGGYVMILALAIVTITVFIIIYIGKIGEQLLHCLEHSATTSFNKRVLLRCLHEGAQGRLVIEFKGPQDCQG